ncbi:MAG: histidine kinase [Cyclobacteriaceae bacterium]
MKRSLILCTLFFSFLSSGQSIDSLMHQLTKAGRAKYLDVLNELAFVYTSGSPDSVMKYSRMALLSGERGSDNQQAKTFWLLGTGKRMQTEYDSAKYFFEQALKLSDDEELTGNVEMGLGGLSFAAFEINEALEHFLSASKIFESLGLENRMAAVYTNIGMVMNANDSDEKALFYFRKSLAISRKLEMKMSMLPVLVNISTLFQKNESFDSALFYAKWCYDLSDEMGSTFGKAKALMVLSDSYTQAGYPEKGLSSSREGKELFEAMGIADLAVAMQKYEAFALKDLNRLDEALTLAHSIESGLDHTVEARNEKTYLLLHDLYSAKGDYKRALDYYQKFFLAYEDFVNREKDELLTELEVKYDTEKKEQKVAQLRQQNEIQQLRSTQQIILFVFAALLAGVLVVFFYQRKLMQQKERTAVHKQQLLRSQMNPHFIFNALTSIRGFLFEKNDLKEAVSYLGQFARLMRLILDHSSREWVTLKEEVEALEIYLNIQKMRFNNGFSYVMKIDPDIDMENIRVPPLLAQPFVENAIEHGFKNLSYEGQVEFICKAEGDLIRFSIIDNGVGIDHVESTSDHGSRALNIFKERIELLAKRLKKNLSFLIRDLGTASKSSGTKVEYTLPINWRNA